LELLAGVLDGVACLVGRSTDLVTQRTGAGTEQQREAGGACRDRTAASGGSGHGNLLEGWSGSIVRHPARTAWPAVGEVTLAAWAELTGGWNSSAGRYVTQDEEGIGHAVPERPDHARDVRTQGHRGRLLP